VTIPVVQHVGTLRQSSSGIRTRRAELANAGLVRVEGTRVIRGRQHKVWRAV
jgi:hypothetical protein